MKRKKFKYIIIVLTILILVIMLFFYLISPKSYFAKHWDNISSDFEIVNDYVLSNDYVLFEDKIFIHLSDLYNSDNAELYESVSKVQAYLKDVNFDGGSDPEIIYNENEIKYTYWERSQYILIYVIKDKNKALQHYKDKKYTIDKLGNGWYLAFQHHI